MQGSEPVRLVVILCCYGQRIEEDEEHHQPVKALGFHIHQTLHPEETVPTTRQTAKKRSKTGLRYTVTVNIACKPVTHTTDSLVVDNVALAFQVIQTVGVRFSTS